MFFFGKFIPLDHEVFLYKGLGDLMKTMTVSVHRLVYPNFDILL